MGNRRISLREDEPFDPHAVGASDEHLYPVLRRGARHRTHMAVNVPDPMAPRGFLGAGSEPGGKAPGGYAEKCSTIDHGVTPVPGMSRNRRNTTAARYKE